MVDLSIAMLVITRGYANPYGYVKTPPFHRENRCEDIFLMYVNICQYHTYIYIYILYIQWPLHIMLKNDAPAPRISVLLSQGRRGLRQALGLFKVVVL